MRTHVSHLSLGFKIESSESWDVSLMVGYCKVFLRLYLPFFCVLSKMKFVSNEMQFLHTSPRHPAPLRNTGIQKFHSSFMENKNNDTDKEKKSNGRHATHRQTSSWTKSKLKRKHGDRVSFASSRHVSSVSLQQWQTTWSQRAVTCIECGMCSIFEHRCPDMLLMEFDVIAMHRQGTTLDKISNTFSTIFSRSSTTPAKAIRPDTACISVRLVRKNLYKMICIDAQQPHNGRNV